MKQVPLPYDDGKEAQPQLGTLAFDDFGKEDDDEEAGGREDDDEEVRERREGKEVEEDDDEEGNDDERKARPQSCHVPTPSGDDEAMP